ncbi:MAG: phage major capsid protein [Clostridiales bacterium]|nr:phage major capsid protein [Clostridiales bacterium]
MDKNKKQDTNSQVDVISIKELEGMISKGAQSIIEDLRKDILKDIQKGIKESKGVTEEEKVEKAAKFVRDFCSGNLEEKAINSDNASFGYTVPTELADFILTKKDKISRIRKLAYTFKLSGIFQLPTEGTGVTAYWVDDNDTIVQSNPTVDKKNLTDNYLTARVLIPRRLLNTSAFNIVSYISELCSRKLRDTEETAFVAGDGAGKPTGIRGAGFTEIAQADAGFAYKDLVNLFYELPEQYREKGAFMTSSAGMKLLRSLVDQNGMPIFDIRDQTIFNRPVYESADIPANLGVGGDETEILFFDPWYYWIKDGEQMFVDTDKILSKLQTELVVAEAVDGVFTLPDAGKKLTGVK